jgi:hypothetical protein
MALVAGAAAGVGMTLVLLPVLEEYRVEAWDSPLFPILVHGGIWSVVAAAGGLGFGLGLGGWAAVPRTLAGAVVGAILGTIAYDLLVTMAFPLAGTSLPISLTATTRLLARLAVTIPAALGAALALRPPRAMA